MNDEDRWFGVFQGYRPHGEGAEEVFAGFPDAAEYVERLQSVCRLRSLPTGRGMCTSWFARHQRQRTRN